jgi:hypothetical protein
MAIPDPEPGLVVHFNYLWGREHDRGREEARYARPCAIVLSYRRATDGAVIVMLAPITHSPPQPGDEAIDIPPAVKRALGLDDQRSWIIIDEVNETAWPGFDLQPNGNGDFSYGFIPPALFRRIRDGIATVIKARRLKRVAR